MKNWLVVDRARNGKEGVGMSPHPVVSIQVVAFRISPKIILKKYNICCIILHRWCINNVEYCVLPLPKFCCTIQFIYDL